MKNASIQSLSFGCNKFVNMGEKTCRSILIVILTALISTSLRDTLHFTTITCVEYFFITLI